MSTYVLRLPSRWLSATVVLGGGVVLFGSEMWDLASSRRHAVPLFPSAAVVSTEESARYPCTTLKGFDVVVRSYYVPTGSGESGTDEVTAVATPSLLSQATSHFYNFVRLFSNETHRVDGADAAACAADAHSFRTVVREEESGRPRSDTLILASSRWPPSTSKYAALVLEPSVHREGASVSPSPAGASRSLLRQMADSVTHQSLVRCNPRSVLMDMACEADPTYLGAPYLRVLLSGFLLLPDTMSQLHVAVLGIGGGSLPLFLQQYFASRLCRCDLVDIEFMCVKAAVEQLGLKELLNSVSDAHNGGGVQYYIEEASSYLRRFVTSPSGTAHQWSHSDTDSSQKMMNPGIFSHHGTPVSFPAATSACSVANDTRRPHPLDLLFVDLFVGSELDEKVTSLDFLQLCRASLSLNGVAAFNLPTADKAFVRNCNAVFGSRNVYRIPVPASSNEVVLARGGAGHSSTVADVPRLSHRHLYRRAREFGALYHLPYDVANHFPVWWRLW